MTHTLILTFAGLGLISLLCQWLAWWVRLPAILFLLLMGIILGPLTHVFQPDPIFGKLLFPIINISAAIILFEGSLTLDFKQIQGLEKVIRRLLTTGVLITFLSTFIICYFLLGLHFSVSAILGSITSISGPTVVAPLLRSVRPNRHISDILRWEGIMVDPIGAILAVIVMELIQAHHGQHGYSHLLIELTQLSLISLPLGTLMGYALGHAIRRHFIPDFLHNVAVLTVVITAYALANLSDEGAGLLTVTLMGVTMANMSNLTIEDIIGFKESLSILLISGLFLILSARINLSGFSGVIIPGLLLLASLQFIVRPLVAACCTLGSNLCWRERIMIGWIAPRGIIAAAIAVLFSQQLQLLHIKDAANLVPLTFVIIIGTVVFQSITSEFVAKKLKVQEPEPDGFLIIGANLLAISIGKALAEHNVQVVLASSNWQDIRQARMTGLETYYGNPTSEHADRHLDLIGIGRCLALSANEQINNLACMRYTSEFGKHNVFYIETNDAHAKQNKHATAGRHLGVALFNKSLKINKLTKSLQAGSTLKTTRLTEQFTFKHLQSQEPLQQPLFLLSSNGKVTPFSWHHKPNAKSNDKIISLKTA